MTYCQDGVQVYFATETQQYTYHPIYGHYELQPNDVNGRPYFKMGGGYTLAIYWDIINNAWWIGFDEVKGQPAGIAYISVSILDDPGLCPHQLSQLPEWYLYDSTISHHVNAYNDILITCKHNVIQIKQSEFRKLMIILMAL